MNYKENNEKEIKKKKYQIWKKYFKAEGSHPEYTKIEYGSKQMY
jgi:hypothetical protein